jgi:hypothetical protein
VWRSPSLPSFLPIILCSPPSLIVKKWR